MATHTDQKIELLKKVPLLSELGGRELEEVGRLADEVDLPANHVLMRQGSSGSEFYVIVDGKVRIERDGKAIATLGPGDFLGENNIANEVDRYIVWPGQALAYKVGQLEIVRLRREAEARLGTRFDIKRFHDAVLGAGAVSLPVLRGLVQSWLVAEGA